MFHLGVFTDQPVNATSMLRQSFAQRMRDATHLLRGSFVACLDRLTATHLYSRLHPIKSGSGIAPNCTSDGQRHVRSRTGNRLHIRRIT